MVLERLFPEYRLERKFSYAFFLGLFYSAIGILIAKFLFPSNTGIVSVIFTSILLSPAMRKIFAKEEKVEEKIKKFKLKKLFSLDYDIVFMYFCIFFGIFLAYLVFAFILPQFGVNTFNLFKEQFFLDPSLKGRAAFSFRSFFSIFYNNWWVLLVTFALGLMAGDGAIFFIAWNASAWGTIFGTRVLNAAAYSGQDPWVMLLSLLFIIIWHILLESGAYILAGIAGSTISHEIIKEKIEVKEFVIWIIGSCILFLALKITVAKMAIQSVYKFLLYFTLTLVNLHYLGSIVAEKKNKEVYTYNIALFLIAIGIFMLGAVLETYVISSSSALSEINMLSACYLKSIPIDMCHI